MPTNREAGSSTTRAGSGGLQRFRDACSKVIRHLRGERSLREAARLHAPGGAEAHALLRRACSFGFTELACAPAEELVGDVHRPTFHLAPANCWINDPNGLVFANNTYHVCFQHQPERAHWDWGLVWGHAVSTDLIHWKLLEHSISPTPGACDSLACFSGCAFSCDDGTITALYTGVRPRRKTTASGLPCGLILPRELPCECFALPPSPRGDRALPSAFSNLSIAAADEAPGGAAGAAAGGESSLIGCAAELYAVTLAADAEEALSAAQQAGEANEAETEEEGTEAETEEEAAVRLAALSELEAWDGSADCDGVLDELPWGGAPGAASAPSSPGGANFLHPYPLGVGGAGGGAVTPRTSFSALSRRSKPVSGAGGSAVGSASGVGGSASGDAAAAAAAAVASAHSDWLDGLAKQPFVESVCGARASCGFSSPLEKLPFPVIAAPPPELVSQLIGWRDPFVLPDCAAGQRVWRMLLGVGIKGRGGAALIYTSEAADGTSGWTYSGILCCADEARPAADGCLAGNTYVGAMWECPFLVPLPENGDTCASGASGAGCTAMFCVSPDRPANAVMYWTGRFSGTRFDLGKASGPFALDTGDVLYAPTVMGPDAGAPGRVLLWGWLQERDAARVAATALAAAPADDLASGRTTFGGVEYSSAGEAAAALAVAQAAGYSGCLSLPRTLRLGLGGRVAQAPAAELERLRQMQLASIGFGGLPAVVPAGGALTLRLRSQRMYCEPGDAASCVLRGAGDALDLCCVLRRRPGGGCAAAGVWRPPAAPAAMGLLVLWLWGAEELWAGHAGGLEAAMAQAADAIAAKPPAFAPACAHADSVQLRVLYDGSAVEAFTCDGGACPGRALATRLYRGSGNGGNIVQLVALGGQVEAKAHVWAMGSIWKEAPTTDV